MKSNRRNFLKTATFASAGAVAGAGTMLSGCSPKKDALSVFPEIQELAKKSHSQRFNMSGYAAPAIPTVRVGVIGLGSRGSGAVRRLVNIEGLEIKALGDMRKPAVDNSQRYLASIGRPAAKEFSGDENIWKQLAEMPDLDLIYICTPWVLHAPMAAYAMESGKHVACEVPLCRTLEEAWHLVETSERTKKHCMMLENCCYDYFELLTLNMARQGMFGDLVHGEGAYIHYLLDSNFSKPDESKSNAGGYIGMWRLKENAGRNGNLYPTHGLGPICQIMNINRGDKMDYLTSMSSNDFIMGKSAQELASKDQFYSPYTGTDFRGNMNTTLVRTTLGRTIMIQHDVSSLRPYSRIHMISGTKGSAVKYPEARIALGHNWLTDDQMEEQWSKYTPEIIKRVGEMAKRVGGHGGMDFIMDWRMIDCLRNGLPLDQDVYDGTLWSSIAPLSEWSVANRSQSIDVPDFTGGSWKNNKPHGINLEAGGTTQVLELKRIVAEAQMTV